MKERKLNFDSWFSIYDHELECLAAESGADRELDFDWNRFIEEEYEKYLDQNESINRM